MMKKLLPTFYVSRRENIRFRTRSRMFPQWKTYVSPTGNLKKALKAVSLLQGILYFV
ncbi:hypothetical protein [uncultured Bacteroides sp.]|uniref:hypothetical protein n=1 Tax=uncultured Bacteroides sp. TaxID=162156 RepID=UPI00280B0723|nr:hypothetical protein [uncultured Bacteroides sp.]